MLSQHPTYRSYLLRLWRAPGGPGQPWRASLQDTLSGERQGFADLEALLAYLRDQIDVQSTPEEESGPYPTTP